MTAAERLAERNDVILALRDCDDKIGDVLVHGDKSLRAAAACRELFGIRDSLCDELIALGGNPGPNPFVNHPVLQAVAL